MILDARVLRAGFVPRELVHRDQELNHLSSVLRPITVGEPAETALLTGPSGAGKTCIARFALEKLCEEALDVESIYVNCWRNYTRYRTLLQILEALGMTVDIHRQSTPQDELINRLQTYDGPRVALTLDEVDQLNDPDVIYELHSLPQFALVCIANREEHLLSRVDDRLVSRLRSSEHVRLEKYRDDQIVDILDARVRKGLEQGAITDDQVRRIASAAAGDARLAIGILRAAAGRADREGRKKMTDDLLLDAASDARAQIKQKTLDSLTPHQRIVFEVVREHGPLGPAEIYEYYADEADDPRTLRTVRSYLSKMDQYNILDAEGTSRDRQYGVATPTPSPTS